MTMCNSVEDKVASLKRIANVEKKKNLECQRRLSESKPCKERLPKLKREQSPEDPRNAAC